MKKSAGYWFSTGKNLRSRHRHGGLTAPLPAYGLHHRSLFSGIKPGWILHAERGSTKFIAADGDCVYGEVAWKRRATWWAIHTSE